MKTSHTPGPWHLDRYNDGSMAIVPSVGFTICPLMPRNTFENDIPNFQLMSAAPELLASASDMLAFITETLPASYWQNAPWLQPARQAIAKAKSLHR